MKITNITAFPIRIPNESDDGRKINTKNLNTAMLANKDLPVKDYEELESKKQKKDKKRALISTKIDKTILGGIKLRIGNTIIDSSIINKLNQLKTTLLKSRN